MEKQLRRCSGGRKGSGSNRCLHDQGKMESQKKKFSPKLDASEVGVESSRKKGVGKRNGGCKHLTWLLASSKRGGGLHKAHEAGEPGEKAKTSGNSPLSSKEEEGRMGNHSGQINCSSDR